MNRVAEVGQFTVFIESLTANFTLKNVPTTTTTATTTTTTITTSTTTKSEALIAYDSFQFFKIQFTLLAALTFLFGVYF